YFTGFMTPFWQSPTRPWFLVLPRSGKPVAVIPTIGVPLMGSCYVGDIKSWASPAASDDGISLLSDVIRGYVPNEGRLGLLMGRETVFRAPLADILALKAGLAPRQWIDVTSSIQHIRMIKSPAEIAKISHICAIVSHVFSDLPSWLTTGIPLADVFREFKQRVLAAGADDVSYLVGSAGQGGYRDIIGPPDERPLQQGDIIMLDTGSVWDGYFSDFDRNFAIGHASDAAHQAHQQLYDATEAALAVGKPGKTPADLYAAMDQVLRPDASSGGGDDVGRYGHGLGIQLTEPPSHTAWDHTELAANMVLTLEPSVVYGDEFLMVTEENILITDHGAELLTTRVTRDLPVIS
ncbi:MAG: M24 family metallopeptidase, partial [Candidatus Puniceispirillales bacterium]